MTLYLSRASHIWPEPGDSNSDGLPDVAQGLAPYASRAAAEAASVPDGVEHILVKQGNHSFSFYERPDAGNIQIDTNGGAKKWVPDVVLSRMLFEREASGNFAAPKDDDKFINNIDIDMKAGTFGSGQAIVIDDINDFSSHDVRVRDVGQISGAGGGTGLIAFKTANTYVENIRFHDYFVEGTAAPSMTESHGANIVDGRFGKLMGGHGANLRGFVHEFKNDSRHNIMIAGTSDNSLYGAGFGQQGGDGVKYSAVVGMAIKDCDMGFVAAYAKGNVISAYSVHADAHPDWFANGNCYGLKLETDANENLVSSFMVTGPAISHPVRIAGSRNAIELAVHTTSAQKIYLDPGATKNFIRVLHPGNDVTLLRSKIADNSGVAVNAATGNVVHSPLTGEEFGSITGYRLWSMTLAGPNANYLGSHQFHFEGDGASFLALGIGTGEQAGISVNIPGAANLGNIAYVESGDYWQFRANSVDTMRVYNAVLRGASDNQLELGNNAAKMKKVWTYGLDAISTVQMTLATYADNAAAIAGGLTTRTLYKTATGEVRVVV